MIRIQKPLTGPAVLQTRGQQARKALEDAYDRGVRKYDFEAEVYGHRQVKQALKTAQHGKCAYCESKMLHISHGDVEHFRPKGGWQQQAVDPVSTSGYYWLAYEWSNLLLSCSICNQRKKNQFPLQDPNQRAKSHHEGLAAEIPMLVHPAEEDPEAHIGFREEIAFPRSERGRISIEVLGLNRQELEEHRRSLYKLLRRTYEAARLDPSEQGNLQRLFQDFQKDDDEYAAMARAAFAAGFEES
jgi:uncharacterized protein (TIGR02646 family)